MKVLGPVPQSNTHIQFCQLIKKVINAGSIFSELTVLENAQTFSV